MINLNEENQLVEIRFLFLKLLSLNTILLFQLFLFLVFFNTQIRLIQTFQKEGIISTVALVN